MAKIRSLCRLEQQQQQGSSSGQAVHEDDDDHQRPLPDDQKIIEPEPEPQLALSVMVSDDHGHHHHQKKVTVSDHGGGLEKLRVIKILRLFGENIPIYHFHIDDESAQAQAMINFHQRLGLRLGLINNPIQQTTHDGDDDDQHKRRKPSDDDDEPESSRHGKKPKILDSVQFDHQQVVVVEQVPLPLPLPLPLAPGAAMQFDHQQVEVLGRALVQFDHARRLMMVEEGVEEVEPVVLFTKRLTSSDVSRQQNRLLITKTDSERLLALLTEAERDKVLTANKGDYVRVVATTPTPNNQEFILHLTKWGGSDAVVLKHQWTKLIAANNLQQGHSIQASAFRLRGEFRLAFTVINN